MPNKPSLLWDLPTRISHWLFVGIVAFSWWSAENDHLDWHTWSGYSLLTLLIFRFVWGFIGSDSARFAHFLRGPKHVIHYARHLLYKDAPPNSGHNPMGGWSVIILLALMLIQVVLGLFSEDLDGLASGPLSYLVSYETGRWAAETHEEFFDLLMVFIALHIGFVLFYLLYKKDNLILPMITGTKHAIEIQAPRIAPLWLAAVVLIAAIVFVVWLVT